LKIEFWWRVSSCGFTITPSNNICGDTGICIERFSKPWHRFYLDEEGDKIYVETDMELLEATQPSTIENVLLICLTVESRQKTSDPSIHSIPIYQNETEQNNTNKQFDEKSKER
jgi:hypothetical protein